MTERQLSGLRRRAMWAWLLIRGVWAGALTPQQAWRGWRDANFER